MEELVMECRNNLPCSETPSGGESFAAHPRFTILVPMEGDRGDLRAGLEQWRSQSYRRDQVEVLLLSCQTRAVREGEALAALGLCDRFLCEEGSNLCRLYDLGARAARGQVLVFTESHCVPEPDFLEQLDLYLRSTGHVGCCCRTIPVCENALARMDDRLCEDGYSVFRQEGDWRKFNIQASGLERQVYLAVGGLAHRYDRYAEMLMAATLRDHGLSLGYAAGPAVRHRFRTGILDVLKDIEVYVDGENVYRRDHPGADRVGHTFLPAFPEEEEKADLLWELCRVLTGEVVRRGWLPRETAVRQAFPRAAWRWLRGGRRACWLAALSTYASILRSHLWQWHRPWLDRSYRQIWKSAPRWFRLRFLQRLPTRTHVPLAAQGSLCIAALAEEDVLGLHPLESYEGQPFRWTGPAAVLRLPFDAHTREVILETRGLRQEPVPLNLAVFVRGRRLPENAVHVEADRIRLRLPAAHDAGEAPCLILTCTPVKPWLQGVPDMRELGFPLFAIHWHAEQPDAHPVDETAMSR